MGTRPQITESKAEELCSQGFSGDSSGEEQVDWQLRLSWDSSGLWLSPQWGLGTRVADSCLLPSQVSAPQDLRRLLQGLCPHADTIRHEVPNLGTQLEGTMAEDACGKKINCDELR